MRRHPRVLGIDDAPFRKGQPEAVPVVGVVMEGATFVEGVAIGSFPVDGDGATEWLADWVNGTRWHPALQGIVLGGITIAGLGIVDVVALAEAVGVPVLAVTRKDTVDSGLGRALETAGLRARRKILERTPPSRRIEDGLFVAHAGISEEGAEALLRATRAASKMPEPLRVAHLIGAALVKGESRGRP
jgi:endonuclease V-like protein UPF0215 family